MILKSITLDNFRQFYGEHEIKFGVQGKKKLTLVRGQNGSGKTAILNAFWWCLYKQTTEKFKVPEKLISLKAIEEVEAGAVVSCKVKIVFDHFDHTYFISRKMSGKKSNSGLELEEVVVEPAVVKVTNSTGKTDSGVGNPEERIKKLLPEALAPYFFFDGENLQHMTEKSKKADLAEAIRLVLGTKVFKRAAADLKDGVRKYYISKKRKHGSDKADKISSEVDLLDEEINKINLKINDKDKEVAALEERRIKIDEFLKRNEKTSVLQSKLVGIRTNISHIKDEIDENTQHKAKVISDGGYLILIQEFLDEAREKVNEARKKGEIPKGYKKNFIDDLIARGRCICNTKIQVGELPYTEVMKWKEKGSYDDVDEIISRLSAELEKSSFDIEKSRKDLKLYVAKEIELQGKLKKAQETESSVLDELGDKADTLEGGENPKDLLMKLEEQIKDENRTIGKYEAEKSEKENLKDEKENEFKKALQQDKLGQVAARKFEVAKKLGGLCDDISILKDLKAWKELESGVQETFQNIAVKNFKISLSEDYEFTVKNVFGEEYVSVGESTGETQMLSLSFIGNLLKLAEELPQREDYGKLGAGFSGGIFPLVIDSPFGQIDDNYRPQIIRAEVSLAPQIILFASGSQWAEEIDEEIRPYVYSEYLLTYNKPKNSIEKGEDLLKIKVNGIDYNYVVPTDETVEFTTIKEI
ncbi:MAG: AAA family ATPase [Halobacteriovoraceae bacterium]|nr:AAA family ATPase [Halobacteriovoraceae bacterium]